MLKIVKFWLKKSAFIVKSLKIIMFKYKIIVYYSARLAMAGGLAALVYFTGLVPGCGPTMFSATNAILGCGPIGETFGGGCSMREAGEEDGAFGGDGGDGYAEDGDGYAEDGGRGGRDGRGDGDRRGRGEDGSGRDGRGDGSGRDGREDGDRRGRGGDGSGGRDGRGDGRGDRDGRDDRGDDDYGDDGYGDDGRGEGGDDRWGDGTGNGRGGRRGRGGRGRRPKGVVIKYDVPARKVDFLMCIDNSSSMAVEHRKIAHQFRRFLPAIKDLDYHFAAITSDISSSPNNPNSGKYWQDGQFLPIGRRRWLRNERIGKRPSKDVVRDFESTITRDETIRCDQANQEDRRDSINCPSSDERCIYSFNLALRNSNHRKFFRRNSHLILIVLSDEDNRSSQDYIDEMLDFGDDYRYEDRDYPETLVRNIFDHFKPSNQRSDQISLKKFSFHSIIIPPEDGACLEEQNVNSAGGEGTGRGYYGEEYARLSRGDDDLLDYGNLLEGSVISICRGNYASQLGKIALAANKIIVPLPCTNPMRTTLYVNGKKVSRASLIQGNTLVTNPGKVPLHANMKMEVTCPKPEDQTEGGGEF